MNMNTTASRHDAVPFGEFLSAVEGKASVLQPLA